MALGRSRKIFTCIFVSFFFFLEIRNIKSLTHTPEFSSSSLFSENFSEISYKFPDFFLRKIEFSGKKEGNRLRLGSGQVKLLVLNKKKIYHCFESIKEKQSNFARFINYETRHQHAEQFMFFSFEFFSF